MALKRGTSIISNDPLCAAASARTVEADSPPDYTLAIGLFIELIAQAVAYFRS
ncbi:hypothetical protein [Massilia rhizosphaerae]|uniref:hypothetical protein n=1 Tax=Massilia rhizosphaerae TaxID=2784389 RepID=UPI0018DD1626|nr:hypothetical protein [Massilia rhizosphaerae]